MSETPPGCTLSAPAFAAASAIYARAATRYEATITVCDDQADIRLRGQKAQIKALLDEMVEREGACCAHLRFDVREIVTGYQVLLSVPESPALARALLSEALPALFPGASITAL